MKASRVFFALALAVAGGLGASAAMPSPAAALTIVLPYQSCQTVDVYTQYSAGGGNLTEVWHFTLLQRITGCWTPGGSTWTTAQNAYVSNWSYGFNNYGYAYAYGSAAGPYQTSRYATGSNPTNNWTSHQVSASRVTCAFYCQSSSGVYNMYQQVLLYPTILSQNGGWRVTAACWFASGLDVSGGCYSWGTTISYYPITAYY